MSDFTKKDAFKIGSLVITGPTQVRKNTPLISDYNNYYFAEPLEKHPDGSWHLINFDGIKKKKIYHGTVGLVIDNYLGNDLCVVLLVENTFARFHRQNIFPFTHYAAD